MTSHCSKRCFVFRINPFNDSAFFVFVMLCMYVFTNLSLLYLK